MDAAGGEVEDDRVVLARTVSAEGSSRAFVGGAGVPVSTLTTVTEPLVAVHGQSDQHRLLRPQTQREALDRFGGSEVREALEAYGDRYDRLVAVERELADVVAHARERAREADLLRFGVGEIEAVAPQPGEDVELAAEEARLGYADTLRTAAEQAREALSSEEGRPDALGATSAARTLLEGVRDHDPEAGELADRLAEVTYLLSDAGGRRRVVRRPARDRPGPAGGGVGASRRPHRAHPQVRPDHRRGAGLGRESRGRLLELDGTDERIEALRAERAELRTGAGRRRRTD